MVGEWQRRERNQAAALGQKTVKRNVQAESINRERMASIDQSVSEIDAQLKNKFPNYATLASAAPVAVEDVQAQPSCFVCLS